MKPTIYGKPGKEFRPGDKVISSISRQEAVVLTLGEPLEEDFPAFWASADKHVRSGDVPLRYLNGKRYHARREMWAGYSNLTLLQPSGPVQLLFDFGKEAG